MGSSDVNSVALDRWAKEREAAQAEEELTRMGDEQFGVIAVASVAPHKKRGATGKA